jgi:GTPase SAR1 family protein
MSEKNYSNGTTSNDDDLPESDFKIILLGDSAVGKSKLIERYIEGDYCHRQLSTYALALYRKDVNYQGRQYTIGELGVRCFIKIHQDYSIAETPKFKRNQ